MAIPIESYNRATYATQTNAAYKSEASSKAGSKTPGQMTIDDFYKLLATQLKYQDADNPMDTSEMMAQMVQTQMIGAITQMSQVNTITYAASMVGKEVEMAEADSSGRFTGETTKGVISGLVMGDNPVLFIGDKGYMMSQIMTIGDVPKPEGDETKPGEGTTTPEAGTAPEPDNTPNLGN